MDSDNGNGCSHPLGFPIRKSPDHSLLAASRGLSQLITSFIAFLRQGIHTHALSSLTIKSTSHTTRTLLSFALTYLCFVCPSNIQLSKISIAFNARQIFNCQRSDLPEEFRSEEPDSLTADRLIWWAWVELNHRPHPYQGCALAS